MNIKFFIQVDKLETDKTYWLDQCKEEIGVLVKVDKNYAYFKGHSEYYLCNDEGLIPLPHKEGFIEAT